MALRVIDANGGYRPAELIEPAPNGYLHIAAQIDPPSMSGPVRATPKTRNTLLLLALHLARLRRRPRIDSVQLFRAAAFPPTSMAPASDQHKGAAVVYDMAILIKTARPADLESAEQDSAYLQLLDILHTRGRNIVLTPARTCDGSPPCPPPTGSTCSTTSRPTGSMRWNCGNTKRAGTSRR